MQCFPISFVFSMVHVSVLGLVTVWQSPYVGKMNALASVARDKRGLTQFIFHHKQEVPLLWTQKVMSVHVYRAVVLSSPSFHTGWNGSELQSQILHSI